MTDMVEILREQGHHDIADEIERLRAEIKRLELRNYTLEWEYDEDGFRSAIREKDDRLRAASETLAASQKESVRYLGEARAHIAKLEAELAMLRGSLSQTQEQRQEFGIIDNVPPNAPR